MTCVRCRLEVQWSQHNQEENGRLEFALFNLGDKALENFQLAYTTLTRIDNAMGCENASLLSRNANLHHMVPPQGFKLDPGQAWRFSVGGLSRPARHRTDGISSAYLVLEGNSFHDVEIGPFLPANSAATRAPVLVPRGKLEHPVALLPWPENFNATDFETAPVALYPDGDSPVEDLNALSEIAGLCLRLFPGSPVPLSLAPVKGGRPIRFSRDPEIEAEGYRLSFSQDLIDIAHSGAAGRTYALISLAQMLRGAHDDPERFSFPSGGSISDRPRYEWRGCHLDVSRHVYPIDSVARFIDILAWNKMNVLHWHLSDDEGWRLEIKAYPELTKIGSRRGPNEKIGAQLGGGAKSIHGFYTQAEVSRLILDAQRVNVQIMPEIDIPGHCTAILASLPGLADGQETPDSYASIQGYTNNSINPAMPEVYEFLEKVFVEIAALFPFDYIHVGGDEVAPDAWLASPKAKQLMRDENLSGTAQIQAYFLRRIKTMLAGIGKKMSGWDEVSHGGGVDPEGTLLMAWQNAELGPKLAKEGYDVVMTPGQAYYLDMVQSEDWQEPGLNWAAPQVPPELTYTYEAAGNFPEGLSHKLKGVQGCIWSENLVSREMFNHMVFPRLSAIAEAAWTPVAEKDWLRFAAICPTMPKL